MLCRDTLLTLAYSFLRLILFTWSISDHLEQIRTDMTNGVAMEMASPALGMAVFFFIQRTGTYYAGAR